MSFRSIWLTSADISVDTFFMLSGLLIVYTTVGKISSCKYLLHKPKFLCFQKLTQALIVIQYLKI